MNLRLFLTLPALLAAPFFTSCESTLDYGYYVGQLNDESILQMFTLMDEAVANRDFDTYESFYSPNYVAIDSAGDNVIRTYRKDYLEIARDLFEDAKYLELNTVVMSITYSENGDSAKVEIQEEEMASQYGGKWHYTSLLDVEVELEEGWIFINRTNRTSKQEIQDTRF